MIKLKHLKSNINEAIEDVAKVDEKVYGTMGHVMADAINTSKKRREEVKKVMEERKGVMPNQDRFAHTKVESTPEMKKMHLSEDAFQPVDLRNRGNRSRKALKESVDENKLAKFIDNSIKGLQNGDATNYRFKLDDRLAVFVGWSDGYDENDDDIIHDKEYPTFGINVGVKVWTSDDMWTDFDFLNFAYYEDSGDVIDSAVSVSPNYNANNLAASMIDYYNDLKDLTIEEDGRIIESNKVEESLDVSQTNPIDTTKSIAGRKPLKEDESDNNYTYYGLFRAGGSIGELNGYSNKYGKILYVFDSEHVEDAKDLAKRRRKSLSKGERSYYNISYTVKPLSSIDLENEYVKSLIDNELNGPLAESFKKMSGRKSIKELIEGVDDIADKIGGFDSVTYNLKNIIDNHPGIDGDIDELTEFIYSLYENEVRYEELKSLVEYIVETRLNESFLKESSNVNLSNRELENKIKKECEVVFTFDAKTDDNGWYFNAINDKDITTLEDKYGFYQGQVTIEKKGLSNNKTYTLNLYKLTNELSNYLYGVDGEYYVLIDKTKNESFLNETDDVDSKKCADILNNWIDWEEADYDSDNALDQLRSLQTEKAITEKEYDFIVKNWDDLLEENFGDKEDKEELTEGVKFGQSSYEDLVSTVCEYYVDHSSKDALESILNLMKDLDEDNAYKLLYAVAEKVEEFVGEELEDSQKYPIESPFDKKEGEDSVKADQKYPIKPAGEKKDSQFVKAEQKAPVGLTESKKLEEDLKVYLDDLSSFEPWSGAVETWEKIVDAKKLDTLNFMLEDMYPEGISEVELNDLLRFDSEWVLDMVGLSDESEDEEEVSKIYDGNANGIYTNDEEPVEENVKSESTKGSEYDIDVSQEEADAIAESLLNMMNNPSTEE